MDSYEQLKMNAEEISSLYRVLCNFERRNINKNGSLFKGVVHQLRLRIEQEDKLMNDFFESEDYDEIRDEVFFNNDKEDEVVIRIKDLILAYESLNIKIFDEDPEDVVLEKKNFLNTGKIFITAAKNIFLVYSYFLQTVIDKLMIRDVKDRLIILKYHNCMLKLDVGNAMINLNFCAPEVVYTDLNLILDLMDVDEQFSESTLIESYTVLISNVIEQLMSNDDSDYVNDINLFVFRIHLHCMLQACFAVMSNYEYEKMKDHIIDKIDILYNSKKTGIVEDIMDIFNNKMEYQSKIRKLSLKPLK